MSAADPFELVPMQSERGRVLLVEHGIDPEDPMTFLVLDEGGAFTESDGVLARNRYDWFGKRETCYLP